MRASSKSPGVVAATRSTAPETEVRMHLDSSRDARHEHDERNERPCYFCLEGWVFLGSVGHDGDEIIESIKCRKCKGTGVLERA